MRLRAWSASAVGMAAAGLVGWSAARPGPPLAGPSRDEVAAIMARPVGLLPLRSLDLATDRGRRVRTYEFAGAMPEGGDPVELEALFLTVWGGRAPDHPRVRYGPAVQLPRVDVRRRPVLAPVGRGGGDPRGERVRVGRRPAAG